MPALITASEICSPVGIGLKAHVESLWSGETPLSFMTGTSLELPKEDEHALATFALAKRVDRHDRSVKLGLMLADRLAGSQNGLPFDGTCGVVMGSSRGPQAKLESILANRSHAPSSSPLSTNSILASALTRYLGLTGPSHYISNSCATALNAVGLATLFIEAGHAKMMIAGAFESHVGSSIESMLEASKVLYRGEPRRYPLKPFAKDRAGMILTEGGAIFQIEADCGQVGLGRILGYASTTEAGSLTGVSRDAQHLRSAILQAMKMARVCPEEIDFVVGHGAGTIKGDAAEIACYRTIFEQNEPPILTHKWLTGHSLGASAGISLALGLTHLNDGKLPDSPYLREYGDRSLKSAPSCFLITALGFGGFASAMIVSRR